MALDALHPTLGTVHSWQYSNDEWNSLRNTYRGEFVFPCGIRADPVISPHGTNYFRHFRKGACQHVPESAEHRELKRRVAEIAEEHGWAARIEHRESNGLWVADTLLEKSGLTLAVEIQLSQQSAEKYLSRTARYEAQGIRVLWLVQKPITDYYRIEPRTIGLTKVFVDATIGAQKIGTCFDAQREIGNSEFQDPRFPIEDALPAMLTVQWHPGTASPTAISSFSADAGIGNCWSCNAPIKRWQVLNLVSEFSSGCLGLVSVRHEYNPQHCYEYDIQQQVGTPPGYTIYGPARTKTSRRKFLAEKCSNCRNLQGDDHPFSYAGIRVVTPHTPVAVSDASQSFPGHWCIDRILAADLEGPLLVVHKQMHDADQAPAVVAGPEVGEIVSPL